MEGLFVRVGAAFRLRHGYAAKNNQPPGANARSYEDDAEGGWWDEKNAVCRLIPP
jgi:hypothetical protein